VDESRNLGGTIIFGNGMNEPVVVRRSNLTNGTVNARFSGLWRHDGIAHSPMKDLGSLGRDEKEATADYINASDQNCGLFSKPRARSTAYRY